MGAIGVAKPCWFWVGFEWFSFDQETFEFTGRSKGALFEECLFSDEVMFDAEVDVVSYGSFKWVAFFVGVCAPGQQEVFDSFSVVGCSDSNSVRFSGGPDQVPELVAFTAIFEEEFESTLLAPA